jgi:hypothetical protein
LTVSVGLIGKAFNRALIRLILCGLLAKRDIIPVRLGLSFVVVIGDVSSELLANKSLLQD